MKSQTFRRGEHVSIDGGPGVVTFLEETGSTVFVDMRSLIEQIGLPLAEESRRLQDDTGLVTALGITFDFTYLDGYKQNSLFCPLDNINDYLYSIPINSLRADVAGNVQHYRQRFAIEADRHWSRLEKSEAASNPLDWSKMIIGQRRYQVTQAVKPLDGEASAVFGLCVRAACFAPKPTDMMDNRELDIYALSLSLALDVLRFCVENGQDFETALQYIQDGLDEHIRPWNF